MSNNDNVQLSTQPLPSMEMPKGNPLTSLFSGQPGPGIELPFQFVIYNHDGSPKYLTQGITSFKGVQNLLCHGRLCTLKELECVVAPTFQATKFATTIDVSWTSNDVVPNTNNILNYPSSSRITIGGPLAFGPSIVPCPFGYINPVIKAPLAFTDFPRLSVACMENPTAKREAPNCILASILVRGIVHVAHPASALSEASTLA